MYDQKFLGGQGVVDGERGSSETCLIEVWWWWGGGGFIKGSFKKHLKTGGG